MLATQTRVALGTLTVFALMLGVAVYVPVASADTALPEADRSIASEMGSLRNASLDRNGDGVIDYTRNCTVTERNYTDANHDGNPEFVFVEVVCREAAD